MDNKRFLILNDSNLVNLNQFDFSVLQKLKYFVRITDSKEERVQEI